MDAPKEVRFLSPLLQLLLCFVMEHQIKLLDLLLDNIALIFLDPLDIEFFGPWVVAKYLALLPDKLVGVAVEPSRFPGRVLSDVVFDVPGFVKIDVKALKGVVVVILEIFYKEIWEFRVHHGYLFDVVLVDGEVVSVDYKVKP